MLKAAALIGFLLLGVGYSAPGPSGPLHPENSTLPATYRGTTLQGVGDSCPSETQQSAARAEVGEAVRTLIQDNVLPVLKGETLPHSYSCGGSSGWTRVAYLDMTNSSHLCPGDMVEATLSGKRVCGRISSASSSSCVSATFSASGLEYSHVCGRIKGYQYGDPDAFYDRASQSIESQYVDGVSLTHGLPGSRQHIWTFATGLTEGYGSSAAGACPCDPWADTSSIRIPSFVGGDYFCESGVTTVYPDAQLYPDDPLWDGDGCTVAGNSCCQYNNPPYFNKRLGSPTTNHLEVRACGYYTRDSNTEDTLIELIELYIKN